MYSTLATGQHPLLQGDHGVGAQPVRGDDPFVLEEFVHRRIPELPAEQFSEALRDLLRCMLRHTAFVSWWFVVAGYTIPN